MTRPGTEFERYRVSSSLSENGNVKHFECPEGDWSFDSEDELEGYLRLFYHEELEHPHGKRRPRPDFY